MEAQLLILMVIIVSVTFFLFLGEKVRISAISVELIIGMFLGNFLFGQIEGFPSIHDPDLFWLQFLADLGFLLLMFLAGLELNVLFLKKFFRKSLILVSCLFFLTFFTGFLLGLAIQLDLAAAVLIGTVFSGASIAIVFPLIHELGLTQRRLGQILITATMALDIVCIFIISFIEFSVAGEFNVLQFSVVILILLLFFIAILYGIGPFWRFLEHRTTQIKALEWEIRISFAVIMVLTVLTGVVLEVEAIIGAFIAGMIMGQSKSAHQLEVKIGSIGYGFFIPIFFFVIGMKMDLSFFANPSFLFMLVTALLILFAIKIGGGILSSKLMGFPWRTGLITGLLLIPSLSVGIAAAELSRTVGLIDPTIFTLLIAIIVISSTIIPIITRNTANRLVPHLIIMHNNWHHHLEHDLGIYLDETYHNIFLEVTVGELPIKEIRTVHPTMPIITILEYMERFHQMDLVVVSESGNQLVGIVDFHDIKRAIIDNKLNETAEIAMRKEFVSVVPSDPLNIALEKMRKHDLETLPIVKDENMSLLGTISRDDILRFVRLRALDASITPEDLETVDFTSDDELTID